MINWNYHVLNAILKYPDETQMSKEPPKEDYSYINTSMTFYMMVVECIRNYPQNKRGQWQMSDVYIKRGPESLEWARFLKNLRCNPRRNSMLT